MVTGSAAISSGVIKPNQVLYDSGAWNCHGVLFRDVAAGGLGSVGSCARWQPHRTATSISSAGARARTAAALRAAYGLGSQLGIDLPGEYAGNWPTEEWTQKTFGPGYHLEPSDVCQLAIGQGRDASDTAAKSPTSRRRW